MAACTRMFGGVAIRRVVTAQRRAALLARPQMDPLLADLHAFCALAAFRAFDIFYRSDMRA